MAGLTVRCYISIDGKPETPVERLTPEQRADAGVRLRNRMRDEISRYYGTHLDEYERLTARDGG